ncbi:MAG: GNAT family N-acetyltransferase [Siphonobacter sp.]
MSDIIIRQGTLKEVIALYPSIPELINPYRQEDYEKRFRSTNAYLILIAYEQSVPVGFKIGYERDSDGSFYSWMGGVSLSHRQHGIARLLLLEMENWCREKSYHSLRFKTRNSHTAMLRFALANGFQISGFEPAEQLGQNRIWLQKSL